MSSLPVVKNLYVFPNYLFGCTSGSEAVKTGAFTFQTTKEVFSGGIIIRISFCCSYFAGYYIVLVGDRKALEQYWLPLSEWNIRPSAGRARSRAILRAFITSSLVILLLDAV